MAETNSKLAASLAELKRLQQKGRRVFRSSEFSRVHRERLLKTGFLLEVMRGWVISSSPDTPPGDSTPWYASFWEFLATYCIEYFGDEWHLSPEHSLLLQAETTAIPEQLTVSSPKGPNNAIELPFGSSLLLIKSSRMPPAADLTVRDGLQLLNLEAALIRLPEAFYSRRPVEARIALDSIGDIGGLLARLLDESRPIVAGRLAGALRQIGRGEDADEILLAMKAADHDIRESDPFDTDHPALALPRTKSPIVHRMHVHWQELRRQVLDLFPELPGRPDDPSGYLAAIDDVYKHDAYHSLSIEGYKVTEALIERVQSGEWNPEAEGPDSEIRSALAARGYWQAFQQVKESVAEILSGRDPGVETRAAHRNWYRELFAPSVTAGILKPSDLAGYRREPVFIRNSRHVPPRWEALADAMPAFFDLLETETEPAVLAVLGHWLFGYLHPYRDGNGRMARFLMNAMFAAGGYPWMVIRVEDRDDYMAALEAVSVDTNIVPFAQFIALRLV